MRQALSGLPPAEWKDNGRVFVELLDDLEAVSRLKRVFGIVSMAVLTTSLDMDAINPAPWQY